MIFKQEIEISLRIYLRFLSIVSIVLVTDETRLKFRHLGGLTYSRKNHYTTHRKANFFYIIIVTQLQLLKAHIARSFGGASEIYI